MQDSAYWWQFLFSIVKVIGILSHKIPKYAITNAIYFDSQSTILWRRSVFTQYFDNWLASFKHQDNSHHSKHAMDHYLWRWWWGGGGVWLGTCFQILLFLSKISTVHFYGWKEWVVTKLVILCSCEKCMIPALAYRIIVLSTPRLLFVEKFCTLFPPPSPPLPPPDFILTSSPLFINF